MPFDGCSNSCRISVDLDTGQGWVFDRGRLASPRGGGGGSLRLDRGKGIKVFLISFPGGSLLCFRLLGNFPLHAWLALRAPFGCNPFCLRHARCLRFFAGFGLWRLPHGSGFGRRFWLRRFPVHRLLRCGDECDLHGMRGEGRRGAGPCLCKCQGCDHEKVQEEGEKEIQLAQSCGIPSRVSDTAQ